MNFGLILNLGLSLSNCNGKPLCHILFLNLKIDSGSKHSKLVEYSLILVFFSINNFPHSLFGILSSSTVAINFAPNL